MPKELKKLKIYGIILILFLILTFINLAPGSINLTTHTIGDGEIQNNSFGIFGGQKNQ